MNCKAVTLSDQPDQSPGNWKYLACRAMEFVTWSIHYAYCIAATLLHMQNTAVLNFREMRQWYALPPALSLVVLMFTWHLTPVRRRVAYGVLAILMYFLAYPTLEVWAILPICSIAFSFMQQRYKPTFPQQKSVASAATPENPLQLDFQQAKTKTDYAESREEPAMAGSSP